MSITILEKHIQESLVALYLRLNGFFTSGHILHANAENSRNSDNGDIDVLAIRLPYSQEKETGVAPSQYLGIDAGAIEIIIGEVKSGKRPIRFNNSIRDRENMKRVLLRIGFSNDEAYVSEIARILVEEMKPKRINNPDSCIEKVVTNLCPIRIRPIIFHLGYPSPLDNQPWFVGHQEIMDDIWRRLRLKLQPNTCQRAYNYELWGPVFIDIVKYFKDKDRTEPGRPDALVKELMRNE